MDLLSRISIDPAICHGRPCIRGTRVYPSLARDDNRATPAYAAELAHERTLPLSA